MKQKFVFLVLIILLAGYLFYGQSIWFYLKTKGYQSVFLTNGQVYFGKISKSGQWIKLSDVYYLQITDPLQPAGNQGDSVIPKKEQSIQLVKLGSELHGPADVMYIEKDKILFWENMKDDSKVLQAIKQNKSDQILKTRQLKIPDTSGGNQF